MASSAAMGTAAPRRRGLQRFSIRLGAAVTFATGGLLALAVSIGWILSSRSLHASVHALVRDSERNSRILAIESDVLTYNRLANKLITSADPAMSAERAAALADMRHNLAEAARLSQSASERAEIESLTARVDHYLAKRTELEQSGAPRGKIVRGVRGEVSDIVEVLHRVEDRYEDALRRSEQRASAVSARATTAGAIAIALVLATLVVAAVGVQVWTVRPLGRIVSALDDLRVEGPPAHAPAGGPSEISRIAEALNETTAALAMQRKQQLAFMGGIGHDLRSPLSSLRVSVELLRQLEPSLTAREDTARAMSSLDRQVDRIVRMVDDLVEASRIEAGELALSRERFDLRETARAASELGTTSAAHAIRVRVPDSPVMVHADPVRMDQVLGNLVSNAIKYSPHGGEVIIGVEATPTEAILSVADQGIGIPSDELVHVFEPFRRGKGSMQVAPGAGLGLSILRRIVTAHGGRIEVESTPGRGSTFYVRLPRDESEQG